MNKKVKIIAASLLATSALVACNPDTDTDNNAMDNGNVNNYENTANDSKDNVTRNGQSPNYVSYNNGTYDRNGAGYNYNGDLNYNGQVANPYPTRNVTMNDSNTNEDGKTAEEITNRVKRIDNVERVSTGVYGDNVVIAVKTNEQTDEKALAEDVRKAAEPYAKDRNIYVTADDDMFKRVDTLNTQIRNGTVTNDLNDDIENIVNDVRAGFNDMTR